MFLSAMEFQVEFTAQGFTRYNSDHLPSPLKHCIVAVLRKFAENGFPIYTYKERGQATHKCSVSGS
jgi:hypothetical protein